MKNPTTFGIDLAKNTIQIAELRNGKVTSNKAISPAAFKTMIITHKPMKLMGVPTKIQQVANKAPYNSV